MSPELYALLERVHGHLAVLGLAVLLHPVLSLGRGRGLGRGLRWSAGLAAVLITVPAALGAWLYPTYRSQVKPGLLRDRLEVASVFESKEHLAFFTVMLTLAGVGALFLGGGEPRTRRVARALLAAAWVCGLCTGLMGIYVAGGAHPGW